MLEVVSATLAHAEAVAANINPADRDEVWASTFSTPLEALKMGMQVSRDIRAVLADGEPICMFGCAEPTMLSSIGTPWLLGTVALPKHARGFLRGSRVYFEKMKQEHGALVNYVDARHTNAVRWLAWLGFTIEPAKPYGAAQLPFHRFHAVA